MRHELGADEAPVRRQAGRGGSASGPTPRWLRRTREPVDDPSMKRFVVAVGMLVACGQGRESAPSAGGQGAAAAGESAPETVITLESPITPESPVTPQMDQASGASCDGSAGCPRGQICVASACRHRRTSVRAEVLTSAADAQRLAGDAEGALASYEEAIGAYADAEAPVPADVACAAALVSLRFYDTPAQREHGARSADRCFRASLPGHPQRLEVLRAVGRLRYDGLSLVAFDQATPPERFFTEDPSRPTVDAVELSLALPDTDEPGYGPVRRSLLSEDATRIVADCFIQDWELRHQREARASLVLELETRMRDMGTHDVYEGTLTVEKTSLDEDGFETCLAAGLTAHLSESRARVGRSIRWQVPFDVAAQL